MALRPSSPLPDPGSRRVPRYRHTQIGWLLIWMIGPMALFALWIMMVAPLRALGPIGFAFVVLAASGWIFSRLHTSVDGGRLRKAFGSGWPAREEDLSRVREVRIVRNPWYYGWGIRITPEGWLWNVSGLEAVELTREDGSRFRVGTNDPEGLKAAIEEEIAWMRRG